MANFRKKTFNRALLFLLAALIALPFQALVPLAASAEETGTWIDGDMPQLTMGDQLTASEAFPPGCYKTTWFYYSYTDDQGRYSPLGRLLPVSVCAYRAGFGSISTSGETFINPNTGLAFPAPYSIQPNPSTPGSHILRLYPRAGLRT
jgi:hypothetical protein